MSAAAVSFLLMLVPGCHFAPLLSQLHSHQSARSEPSGSFSNDTTVFPQAQSMAGERPVPSRKASHVTTSPRGWVVPGVAQTRTLSCGHRFPCRTTSQTAGSSGSRRRSASLKATHGSQKNGSGSRTTIDSEPKLSDSIFPWHGGSPSWRQWPSDQYLVSMFLGHLKNVLKRATKQQNDLSEQKPQSPIHMQMIDLRSVLRLRDSLENMEDVLFGRSHRDWSRLGNRAEHSNDKTLFNDMVTPLVDTLLLNGLNPLTSYGGALYGRKLHSLLTGGHFNPSDIMWDSVCMPDESPLWTEEDSSSALPQSRVNPKAYSSEDDLSAGQTMKKRSKRASINLLGNRLRHDSTLLSHTMRPFHISKKRAKTNRGELARRLHQPGQLLSLVTLTPWSRRGRVSGREDMAKTRRRLLRLFEGARPPRRFDSTVTRRGGYWSLT